MAEEEYVEKLCAKGHQMEWIECEQCGGEGLSEEHDCGEDTCACLEPEPNVDCDVCDGDGGWWHCETCYKQKLKGEY